VFLELQIARHLAVGPADGDPGPGLPLVVPEPGRHRPVAGRERPDLVATPAVGPGGDRLSAVAAGLDLHLRQLIRREPEDLSGECGPSIECDFEIGHRLVGDREGPRVLGVGEAVGTGPQPVFARDHRREAETAVLAGHVPVKPRLEAVLGSQLDLGARHGLAGFVDHASRDFDPRLERHVQHVDSRLDLERLRHPAVARMEKEHLLPAELRPFEPVQAIIVRGGRGSADADADRGHRLTGRGGDASLEERSPLEHQPELSGGRRPGQIDLDPLQGHESRRGHADPGASGGDAPELEVPLAIRSRVPEDRLSHRAVRLLGQKRLPVQIDARAGHRLAGLVDDPADQSRLGLQADHDRLCGGRTDRADLGDQKTCGPDGHMDRNPMRQVFDGEASVRRHGRGGLAPLERPLHLLGTGRPVQEEDFAAGDGLTTVVDHAAGQRSPGPQGHDAEVCGSGAVGDAESREEGGGVSLPADRQLDLGGGQLGEREETLGIALDGWAVRLLRRSIVLGLRTEGRTHDRLGLCDWPAGSRDGIRAVISIAEARVAHRVPAGVDAGVRVRRARHRRQAVGEELDAGRRAVADAVRLARGVLAQGVKGHRGLLRRVARLRDHDLAALGAQTS
jgi:hypothetical protein